MTSSIRVPESVYEQWLVDNLHEVFHESAELLARQPHLPSGRIPDLLVLRPPVPLFGKPRYRIQVIELKAGKADLAAVGQLLSYVGEIRTDLENAGAIDVEGLLMAPAIDQAARYALMAARCHYVRWRVVVEHEDADESIWGPSTGIVRQLVGDRYDALAQALEIE